jgi:hypothetical protein
VKNVDLLCFMFYVCIIHPCICYAFKRLYAHLSVLLSFTNLVVVLLSCRALMIVE